MVVKYRTTLKGLGVKKITPLMIGEEGSTKTPRLLHRTVEDTT